MTVLGQLFVTYKTSVGRRERTTAALEDAIVRFLQTPGVPADPRRLTADHLVAFLATLWKRQLRPSSVNHYQRAVNEWIRWLFKRGSVTWDFTREVDTVRVPMERMRMVTNDVMARMLTAAIAPPVKGGRRPNRERNVALLRLMFDTGLRRGELTTLRYDDIDLRNNVLRLRGAETKDSEWRLVPFSTSTRHALLEYNLVRRQQIAEDPGVYFRCDNGAPISASAINQTIQALRTIAGVDVSAHSFRAGAIARMRKGGLDVLTVMSVVGHNSPTMTRRYSGDTEKQAAVDAWHQRFG